MTDKAEARASEPIAPEDVFICCFNRVRDGHSSACARNSPPPSVSRMDEPCSRCIGGGRGPMLDPETERLIFNVTDAGIAHGFASDGAPVDKMHKAEDALRLRIAQLISEARAEGAQEVYDQAREVDGGNYVKRHTARLAREAPDDR